MKTVISWNITSMNFPQGTDLKNMRNIYKIILFALLLATALSATSASQTLVAGDVLLVGIWKADPVSTLNHMDLEDRAAIDSLPDLQREGFIRSLSSRIFEFQNNGRFLASWEAHGKPRSILGTWSMQEDGILQIVFPDGVSDYRASFPSTERMSLERLNNTGGMVKTLFFTKSGER